LPQTNSLKESQVSENANLILFAVLLEHHLKNPCKKTQKNELWASYETHTNHNNRSCAVGGLWRVTAVVSFFRNTTR
jgi:hypothetical protein